MAAKKASTKKRLFIAFVLFDRTDRGKLVREGSLELVTWATSPNVAGTAFVRRLRELEKTDLMEKGDRFYLDGIVEVPSTLKGCLALNWVDRAAVEHASIACLVPIQGKTTKGVETYSFDKEPPTGESYTPKPFFTAGKPKAKRAAKKR